VGSGEVEGDFSMGVSGEIETEGAGVLFLEVDDCVPTQCVLCHEGGTCSGKGGKPLGCIALIQPSTVLSVIARRQRDDELQRLSHHEHTGMGGSAPYYVEPSSSSMASSAVGGAAGGGSGGGGAYAGAGVRDKSMESRFVCGYQMVAEASVAGWEGVCAGTGPGAQHDAPATGVVVSFCGHAMHSECLKRFLDTQRGHYGDHGAVSNENEFVCPLCRSLGNALVPLSPLATPGVAAAASAAQEPSAHTHTTTTAMLTIAAFGSGGWGGSVSGGVGDAAAGGVGGEDGVEKLMGMSVKELKKMATQTSPPIDLRRCFEKQEMVDALLEQMPSHSLDPLLARGRGGQSQGAPEWWATEPAKSEGVCVCVCVCV